ncbi:MAG: hypothetical protein KatS3mg076_2862 [Candidatus Binatia bacterium]|nr:MAG: hypothetical protein KatS3mg076_2862 [Candidatus Binatia bacterium]
MRRRLAIGSGLLALLVGLPHARALLVDRVVATLDGEPVTLYEVKTFARKRSGGRLPPEAEFDVSSYLDDYLTEKILEKEIADAGIRVTEEDVDRYVEQVRSRNRLSEEGLRAAVAAQGLEWEEYREHVRREIEKAQLVHREIRGKVNVTPEDVRRYYEAHKQDYALPESFHLRHIVLLLPEGAAPEREEEAMKLARDLVRRLRSGESFEKLARRYSQDSAAEEGGDLGWVRRGEMLEEIERVVLGLDEGEVSDPVRTSVGVHIVRVEKRSGSRYRPLEEVAPSIREKLYAEALQNRFDRWLREDLKKRHHIEIRP